MDENDRTGSGLLSSKRPKTPEEVKEGIASERDDYLRGLDVEMRADMDPLLKDDPLARLGYSVDALRYKEDNGLVDATHRRSTKEVTYGPETGASEDVIAHEVRHRGMQILKELYEKDPAGFVKEYGTSAETVLNDLSSELQVEFRDNPDATWRGTQGTHSMSDTLDSIPAEMARTYRDTGKIKTNSEHNDGILTRGFKGLDRAALDLMKERGDVDRVSPKEPEEKGFFRRILGYNEGGLAMDDQMEAVFKSSRTDEVDPVSGNEVPTGALPEEVRDDVPAQLSEGEYIVPADVVRYFGVKFFEDIRSQAKQGFQELEQGGRIGGDPVGGMEMGEDELPFDISELQMVDDEQPEQPEMNKGGYVSGYADGGDVTQMKLPDFMRDASQDTANEEYRVYTNAAGQTMSIRFIDGKPVTAIPPGYTLQGSAVESVAPKASTSDTSTAVAPSDKPEAVDWGTATVDQFNDAIKTQSGMLGKVIKGGASMLGGPLAGLATDAVFKMQTNAMLKGIDTQLENKELDDTVRTNLQGIRTNLIADRDEDTKLGLVEASGIYGGQSSMKEGLKDTSGDGKVSFADTWLGDALGFDDDGFGVQGDSLKESRAGSRRTTKEDEEDKK